MPGTEEVGNLAFAQSGVKKVRMEGSGRGYGRDIFFQCLHLRRVVLEEGVRHIPDRLAYGCSALEQVALPGTLESVGRHVWGGDAFSAGVGGEAGRRLDRVGESHRAGRLDRVGKAGRAGKSHTK